MTKYWLNNFAIDDFIISALKEDMYFGDITTDSICANLDEKEFGNLCDELIDVAKDLGISEDKMTTIIAKAVRNREIVVSKNNTKAAVGDQVIYGPPARKQSTEIKVTNQVIYGPPPHMFNNETRKSR